MKRFLNMKFFSVLLVVCLFLCALTVTLSASVEDGDVTAIAEDALTYEGISTRTTGDAGIRSLYSVDPEKIALLEQHYNVAYGAVMGIGEYGGSTYAETGTLAVSGSFDEGFAATEKGSAVAVIYATGSPDYATGRYTDAGKTNFAYTTLYPNGTAEQYGIGLVYTGFLVLSDKTTGECFYFYDRAEGGVFGGESATYGKSTTVSEVADYFVNAYSGSAFRKYEYNQNTLLRSVLATTGVEARTVAAPVTLIGLSEQQLTKTVPWQYVGAARSAYVSAEYADYSTSIIQNYTYSSVASDYLDRPNAVVLSWEKGANALGYTVELSENADFTSARVIETTASSVSVYNLKVNTTYYWRVTAVDGEGLSYQTPTSTFRTANGVRWIYIDGVRNARDVGGWTGLKQGLLYRGSELNAVGGHGLAITASGIDVMQNVLGIKTDLDFRAVGDDCGNITESPIGGDTVFMQIPASNFMAVFGTEPYQQIFSELADYSNYPIYMHCWGGADRTGTVAFMLEGLCGVSEEDLAIDLELTSFSIFGNRYRYDNSSYLYASMLSRMKTYPGDTLQEKFEACAKNTLRLTEAEVSNIQNIFLTDGALFDASSLEDLYYDEESGEDLTLKLIMRGSRSVSSLTVDGKAFPFSFENGTLTLAAEDIEAASLMAGLGVITFDDGSKLSFYVRTSILQSTVDKIAKGEWNLLLADTDNLSLSLGVLSVADSDGAFRIPAALVRGLVEAGYESLDLTVLATGSTLSSASVSVYDEEGVLVRTVSLAVANGTTGKSAIRLPLTEYGDLAFSLLGATDISLSGFALKKEGTAWMEGIEAGNYAGFFGAGTNGTDEDGDPILTLSSTNHIINEATIKRLMAAGVTHVTLTLDVTYPEGTEACYIAIRVNDGTTSTKFDTLTGTAGHIHGSITLPLKGGYLQFIARLGSVGGHDVATSATFVISDISFTLPENEKPLLEQIVTDGRLDKLFTVYGGGSAELDTETGTFIPSTQCYITPEVVRALYEAGYTAISFRVDCAASTNRIVMRWFTGSGEGSWSWQAYNKSDLNQSGGVIGGTVTVLLDATTVNDTWYFGIQPQSCTADIVISQVTLVKPKTDLIVTDGEWDLLFEGTGASLNKAEGTVVVSGAPTISNATLQSLYDAGYRKISFHVYAETSNRVVIRWYNGSWQTADGKRDLSQKNSVASGTVTFTLNETYLSNGWWIRLENQGGLNGGAITFSEFTFTK